MSFQVVLIIYLVSSIFCRILLQRICKIAKEEGNPLNLQGLNQNTVIELVSWLPLLNTCFVVGNLLISIYYELLIIMYKIKNKL